MKKCSRDYPTSRAPKEAPRGHPKTWLNLKMLLTKVHMFSDKKSYWVPGTASTPNYNCTSVRKNVPSITIKYVFTTGIRLSNEPKSKIFPQANFEKIQF